MNPLNALAAFAVGLIHEGHLQGWMKLAASMIVSAFVSFLGTFGIESSRYAMSGISAPTAFVLSIGHASVITSVIVVGLWVKSPMTKGIPILYPGKIEAQRLEQLASDGTVYNPNEKK